MDIALQSAATGPIGLETRETGRRTETATPNIAAHRKGARDARRLWSAAAYFRF